MYSLNLTPKNRGFLQPQFASHSAKPSEEVSVFHQVGHSALVINNLHSPCIAQQRESSGLLFSLMQGGQGRE